MLCAEVGHNVRCWMCNNSRCKCCECAIGNDCWSDISLCSYQIGCCVT